ncbi:hypothetical protein GCM10025857_05550 [Alicyclobacillus contaminans]|uniref:isochorismatase family protein n=1 Tax=Alicyclobacillus contaminans TaxID=392016 RepID=UPI0004248FD9|nr:isochorismatase family protein [Alicyclobacillus contaminans]GMA49198.1 hypothetical protein GCM10025857_05550 [Alicyclobacillus contaminans]
MNTALLVLDVQSDFLGNTIDYVAPLCQRFVDERGADYSVVILTQWTYPEQQGRSTLAVHFPGAEIVEKTGYSGYTAATREILEQRGIEEVHLAGVDAEGAVLATLFGLVDAGYRVKVLERLVASYHGRNWESMMIARHVLGKDNVVNIGGGSVYV